MHVTTLIPRCQCIFFALDLLQLCLLELTGRYFGQRCRDERSATSSLFIILCMTLHVAILELWWDKKVLQELQLLVLIFNAAILILASVLTFHCIPKRVVRPILLIIITVVVSLQNVDLAQEAHQWADQVLIEIKIVMCHVWR